MSWIGGCRGVATCALEYGIVARVCVAGGTNTVRVAVIQREEGVVLRGEIRGQPGSRCVARIAGRRPVCSYMVRIRGSRVVSLMA